MRAAYLLGLSAALLSNPARADERPTVASAAELAAVRRVIEAGAAELQRCANRHRRKVSEGVGADVHLVPAVLPSTVRLALVFVIEPGGVLGEVEVENDAAEYFYPSFDDCVAAAASSGVAR